MRNARRLNGVFSGDTSFMVRYNIEKFKQIRFLLFFAEGAMFFGNTSTSGEGDGTDRGRQPSGRFLIPVFLVYLLILFLVLFAKEPVGSFQSVNLVPFATIRRYVVSREIFVQSFAINNLIGNVVLFIPLGIYIGLFRPKRIAVNTLLVAAISLFIEGMQYLLAVGVADVDDVILNTIGGFCGLLVFRLLERVFPQNVARVVEILAPLGAVVVVLAVWWVNR